MLTLKEWIKESRNIVFMGGAGVSTESGIPDFRSAGGLYENMLAEEMLSIQYFERHTDEFYTYFKEHLLFPDAKPNKAHYALAKLEQQGKLKAVITQNIDGLHQMAGSQNVIELHGNALDYYCMDCGKTDVLENILKQEGTPKCTCGGTMRPDIVMYGEMLNENRLQKAVEYISNADLLIVGGTSLVVYPVAGLVEYVKKGKFVIINRGKTAYDEKADLVIRERIGETLGFAVG